MKLCKIQENEIEVTEMSTSEILLKISNDPVQGDDPFFVADLGDIISKVDLWKRHFPRVKPYYAVKCCPSPVVLELLKTLGVNFDCASKAEIESVMKLGVNPSDRMIYANPCKTKSYIRYAQKCNVDLMTFDNILELHKVKELYPDARMILRLKVDNKECISELSLKFGASIEDVPILLQTAKDLDINIVGVSFHVGSGCENALAFEEAIADAHWTFQQAAELGFENLTILDIGGGFPGDRSSPITFEEVAAVVNKSLDKYFPVDADVYVIAEPGRFFVSSAFTLCTNIIAKRTTTISQCVDNYKMKIPCNQYYINDGVYGALNCVLFEHRKLYPHPLQANFGPSFVSNVWGPTCDSIDLVAEGITLPELDVGTWLVFDDVGAYTICAASNFNGFGPSKVFYHISSYDWMLIKKTLICVNCLRDSYNKETSLINCINCRYGSTNKSASSILCESPAN